MSSALPTRTGCARAPGKLILTGEHAVVHGCPALVVALDRELKVTLHVDAEDSLGWTCTSRYGLEGHDTGGDTDPRLAIDARYEAYQAGELPVGEVLGEGELLDYVLAAAGWSQSSRRTVDSDIPTGCGMGSSAAVALATALAAGCSPTDALAIADRTETLQHGQSSGLDARVCLHGGAHRYEAGALESVPPPHAKFQLINTGQPAATTGECVDQVGKQFPADDPIWDDFRAIANTMAEGVTPEAVRENQRLLTRIGVVPEAVQMLVRELESRGLAAKICGAGSVRPGGGGVLWVVGESDAEALTRYDLFTARLDTRGAESLPTGEDS